MNLDYSHKHLRRRAFERNLKNIYDMKTLVYMNIIHDNKVNILSKFKLLHDIINPYKHNKNINSHHSPILHGYMNPRRIKPF